MELGAASLREQPFRLHAEPIVFVSYEAQQRAHAFLTQVSNHPTGLGLLRGPLLSGKSTLIRSFVDSLDNDSEVAVVDGANLNTTALLEAVLSQFGYTLRFNSVNELINMLKVYVLQRTVSEETPMLIIENTHAMKPSALRILCELAELRVRQKSALRLLLVSDRSLETIIRAPAMECISSRVTGHFELGPMTEYETTDFLHEKLKAGGCPDPERVIPEIVCSEFHAAAGGWPGILDRIALLALAKAPHCPVTKEHVEYPVLPKRQPETGTEQAMANKQIEITTAEGPPQLFLTQAGDTLKEISLYRSRLVIGRSEHNDLQIDSKYISRHHAMFMRNGDTTFLMDLNSTNGTYVNSCRISNYVMQHNDIISLGNHRIKFVHPGAAKMQEFDDAGSAETTVLKTLQDMRQMLASGKHASHARCP